MKFQLPAVLLGLVALVSAQEQNQTGPFFLHITGKDGSTLDGHAASCHAGAAIEGLCYNGGAVPEENLLSYQYWFNFTGATTVEGSPVGTLSWKMPATINDTQTFYPQELGLNYQLNSNVAQPMFGLGGYFNLGFDGEGKLFGYAYYDDSTFTPGTNPLPNEDIALYNWYVCWQYFTGYYYQSVGWSQTGPPHNPTCEPVDITMVDS